MFDEQSGSGRVLEPEVVPNGLSEELSKLAVMVKDYGQTVHGESEKQDYLSAHDRLTGMALQLEERPGEAGDSHAGRVSALER